MGDAHNPQDSPRSASVALSHYANLFKIAMDSCASLEQEYEAAKMNLVNGMRHDEAEIRQHRQKIQEHSEQVQKLSSSQTQKQRKVDELGKGLLEKKDQVAADVMQYLKPELLKPPVRRRALP